jgi:hypothetical protein
MGATAGAKQSKSSCAWKAMTEYQRRNANAYGWW